jgi:uncharacterized protein YbjT (DUF2867 family)
VKIVVIGGSGLIGRKLVDRLRQRGHEAMAEVWLVPQPNAAYSRLGRYVP